jgi:small-conductance mechanosensitive channel
MDAAPTAAGEILATWGLPVDLEGLIRLGFLLALVPVVLLVARVLHTIDARRWTLQAAMLISRGFRYLGLAALLLMALKELGFHITPLLGALGVVGVAVGFASQTSLGNIIAGFFLLGDRARAIDELVRIDGVVGEIHSIDLLSIKVRTFDNQLIRVSNENLLKMNLVTINKFPIRRVDISISVAYKEQVQQVRDILGAIAEEEPLCLDEPEPLILFKNFGDSGLEFLFGVWCSRDDFLPLKNAMMDRIKERFDEAGIEIPFPHLTVYPGSAASPFSVSVADDRSGNSALDKGL